MVVAREKVRSVFRCDAVSKPEDNGHNVYSQDYI
jgi:hypothetical protein